MTQMIAGLVLFFGVHLVPTRPVLRERLAAQFGAIGYQAVFALVSLAGLVLMIRGYGAIEYVGLWFLPNWTRHIAMLLMLPVLPLLIAAYLRGTIKRRVGGHPMLLAVKFWAVAHLLVTGDLAAVLLFGGFLAYAVAGLVSAKRRQRAAGVVMPDGPARNDAIAVVAGLAIYVLAVFRAHEAIIGVAPVL